MKPAIATVNLTCRYGRTEAVRDLALTVEPGRIYALLGPNGAGKTSAIRMLMNILRPSGGRATVLGVDSRRLGPSELAAIGYVSENQKLPAWMTVDELLTFCRPFYPTWDDALGRKLLDDFDLSGAAKIGRLSRGMRVKAALVSSLAYRPQLLAILGDSDWLLNTGLHLGGLTISGALGDTGFVIQSFALHYPGRSPFASGAPQIDAAWLDGADLASSRRRTRDASRAR